jgi:hypothetical protein
VGGRGEVILNNWRNVLFAIIMICDKCLQDGCPAGMIQLEMAETA